MENIQKTNLITPTCQKHSHFSKTHHIKKKKKKAKTNTLKNQPIQTQTKKNAALKKITFQNQP